MENIDDNTIKIAKKLLTKIEKCYKIKDLNWFRSII